MSDPFDPAPYTDEEWQALQVVITSVSEALSRPLEVARRAVASNDRGEFERSIEALHRATHFLSEVTADLGSFQHEKIGLRSPRLVLLLMRLGVALLQVNPQDSASVRTAVAVAQPLLHNLPPVDPDVRPRLGSMGEVAFTQANRIKGMATDTLTLELLQQTIHTLRSWSEQR